VKNVVDFSLAADEINFMMKNDLWHPALEGDRVANLFGEPAAFAAIMTYIKAGGAANLKRAKSSLSQFPQVIGRVLPTVTKRSEAGRLATLTTLSKEQIETLPEHLYETILLTDLGL
jgi:hypothetical protein